MNRKVLLSMGFAAPVAFWATTIVCGRMLGDYDHLHFLVSELGALGTPSQHVFSAGLVLCSILNVLFVLALYRCCREQHLNAAPAALLLFFSFLAGPALVPMPLPLHNVVGMPMLVFFLSPPAALLLWTGERPPLELGGFAALALVLIGLGFLVYFPGVLAGFYGLKQRFMYAGWTIWSSGLAFRFLQRCPALRRPAL